jgi:hypothetical protein
MLSPEFMGIAGGGLGYPIKNSLRFRASNSAYLNRTPAGAGNRKTWTWSAWVKRGTLGGAVAQTLFVGDRAGASDATYTDIVFTSADQIAVRGSVTNWRITSGVFRDPSAWYHVVVALDTTQATAGDRVKVYVNGSQITAFGTSNNPSLNADLGINQAALHAIARDVSGGPTFFDGHLTHVHLIDGQALTPSSFGKTDAVTGEWVPIQYSGTYGTNGFRLAFEDAASTTTIGYDTSGNSNNFTTSGISVTSGVTFDQSLDTPTLNFPVWSPIDKGTVTVSEGNTAAVPAADVHAIRATMAIPSSGKWYWEIAVSALGYGTGIGIADNVSVNTTGPSSAATRTYQFGSWFNSFNGGVVQYGTSQAVLAGTNWTAASQPAANDIIMVAVDMDNGSMWVGKNGTWFNSSGTANPATNTDPRWTSLTGTTWFPYMAGYGTASPVTCRANFGQRAFSYTPPTGFSALNTANLAAPSIKKSSLYMDATLRTGTGATASVSSLGFQPDLVWIKSRSAATNHNMFDSGRGVQKGLGTNWSGAEYTDANTLTAFNSNGYSLGSDASSRGVNINTNTYVDWSWKKGATPGFDVVTFTGNATNRTISHGLGVVPEMMMIRTQGAPTGFEPFVVYHSKLNGGTNPANYYLYSTQTAAEAATAAFFNNTMPTSSVFTVGTDSFVNQSGTGIVAYLFAGVEGFSKFGSYVGNGATDGPFVWCGFKPRWIMWKRVNLTGSWGIYDTARSTFNAANSGLLAEGAGAEFAYDAFDILSNGFKVRASGAGTNGSGDRHIFAAFADVPFKYSRAR